MAVINLRNVVALGVLEDGVYPSVYNGQTGEYIGTVDGEGAGVKTVPTLYMYYRKNGHLYLYTMTKPPLNEFYHQNRL